MNALPLALLLELNIAVTPAGTPDAVNATGPLKPFSSKTVIFDVELAPPTIRDMEGFEFESAKEGPVITRTIGAEDVALPSTPITFSVYVPGTTYGANVSDNIVPFSDLAKLNVAKTPAGNPVIEKHTDPVSCIRFSTPIQSLKYTVLLM